MGEYVVKRPVKRPPLHPGEIVREDVLPALGLSVSAVARRLGISRQQYIVSSPVHIRLPLKWRCGLGSWLVTGQDCGCACSRRMMCGTVSGG